MSRFFATVAILLLLLVGECYFLFLKSAQNKPANSMLAPSLTFPDVKLPQPNVSFRPLFGKGETPAYSEQGFHLVGIIAEGDRYYAVVKGPGGIKTVRAGAMIDGAMVEHITKRDVMLKIGAKQVRLQLPGKKDL